MKIMIIRHGDPDYAIDSLTEKGKREAELLARKMQNVPVKDFYVSPLGRAKDTAAYTLAAMGRTAKEMDWLREFHAPIKRPDRNGEEIITWDWLPQDWTMDERFYQYDHWYENEIMAKANVKVEYDRVVNSFDDLIAEYGYVRDGHVYRVEKGNTDTIALFCHFGVGCVIASHLMSVSPMILWHNACAAPTSVTTFVTEERRKGIASFRMNQFGSTEHLYVEAEPPAFAARFCEAYENESERHD